MHYLRHSRLLHCLAIMAFVFALLPLSPMPAYADETALLAYVGGFVVGLLLIGFVSVVDTDMNSARATDGQSVPPEEQESVAKKDDKEKVLVERFAKLNTKEDGVSYPKARTTYPVFEW